MTLATHSPTLSARFTPEQYFYLSVNNMLGDGRTELIEGEIIHMCSQYDEHAYGVSQIADYLRSAFSKKTFWVRVQMTLHCGNSVPEPDLAVIGGAAKATRTFMKGERAKLVIEVADSTVLTDTRIKTGVYAAVGVPEYWVLDIPQRRLIVHREPELSKGQWRYAVISVHGDSESVAPLAAAKRKARIADFLP